MNILTVNPLHDHAGSLDSVGVENGMGGSFGCAEMWGFLRTLSEAAWWGSGG